MRYFCLIAIAALAVLARAAGAAELTDKEIAAARKIYLTKCAKCHELYDPKAYTDAEWATWMTKMGKKSKLKADQLDQLIRYTATLRVGAKPPAKE